MSIEACLVDTSAWYLAFVHDVPGSAVARNVFESGQYRFLTSDFIVDELLSLLKTRNQYRRRDVVWSTLNNKAHVEMVYLTKSDLNDAYKYYDRFKDKNWSFTDCTSYHLIRSRRIPFAFSLDRHFREFGIVTVLP